jgi:cytochrome P450
VGPNEVSFATVTAQNIIYANKDGKKFCKAGSFPELFLAQLLNAPILFTLPDGHDHENLRKQLQPAFTMSALHRQESIYQFHLNSLVSRLDHMSDKEEEVNLTHELSSTVWDLSNDLSFGEPLLAEYKGKLHANFFVNRFSRMSNPII